MSRNSVKIVCGFMNTDISVSYKKLMISRKNRAFLDQFGNLDTCLIEIRNAFGSDGFFSMIDLRIIRVNGKNIFLHEFNPIKPNEIYESHQKIDIPSDQSESTEIELPDSKISQILICDIVNNLSDYLNKKIKKMRKSKANLIEQYFFIYKLNILPDKNIKKISELYFMIKIRKFKKEGQILEDPFLKNLRGFISSKNRNGFITEIAPYLTSRELNYILTEYSDIQEEWFEGKSEKIALKYRTLYSKKKINVEDGPEKKISTGLGLWPLKKYESEYGSQVFIEYDGYKTDDVDRKKHSSNNFTEDIDDNSISFVESKSKVESKNVHIKREEKEKVVEIQASLRSDKKKNDKNAILSDKDKYKEEISTTIVKKGDEKAIFPESFVEQLPESYLETLSHADRQKMNPFDFEPGWQDAIFSREEINRIIQDKLDKMLMEGDRKTSDDDFSDERSEITLSESLTTLINTNRNRPFLLKVLSLCQDIYGNMKEKVSPNPKKSESSHIDIIKSLNLPEKQISIRFLKTIQSNQNIMKYTRCLEYMNDTPMCVFVFDLAVVRGKLSSRKTLKGEKIFKFHPLPGQLHYAIFKQNNLFYISKFTSLEFVHVRKETEIVENADEVILRNTQKNGQINFDIFHGNPFIEYGDDSVILKGKNFKILVEISPTHWQSVYVP